MKNDYNAEKGITEYISIYVTKEQKKNIEDAQSVNAEMKVIDEVLKLRKRDFKADMEALDSDLLIYKWQNGASLFQKLATSKMIKIITCGKGCKGKNEVPSYNKKIEELEKKVKPVADIIDGLCNKFDKVNSYKFDRILEIIRKIESMTEKEAEIMHHLIESGRMNNE